MIRNISASFVKGQDKYPPILPFGLTFNFSNSDGVKYVNNNFFFPSLFDHLNREVGSIKIDSNLSCRASFSDWVISTSSSAFTFFFGPEVLVCCCCGFCCCGSCCCCSFGTGFWVASHSSKGCLFPSFSLSNISGGICVFRPTFLFFSFIAFLAVSGRRSLDLLLAFLFITPPAAFRSSTDRLDSSMGVGGGVFSSTSIIIQYCSSRRLLIPNSLQRI